MKKGKYAAVMEERSLNPMNDRDSFDSDEIFANFRALHGGKLKENLIYRSSSPIDNTWLRAPYVDELCEKYGIRYIVNLSDSKDQVQQYFETGSTDSAYYRKIYEEGNVLFPELSIGFETPQVRSKIVDLLNTMVQQDGPYLLHCSLGKDRSVFVSLLLEMLAGASYEEMLEDYMLSYESFYRVTEISDPKKYETIVDHNFVQLMQCIVTDASVDLQSADLVPYAKEYLLSGGMTPQEQKELEEIILQ